MKVCKLLVILLHIVYNMTTEIEVKSLGICVVTNNPLVKDKLGQVLDVQYIDKGLIGILETIRDQIHKGAVLLTHPLSGSVKPNETPYKSVIIDCNFGKTTDFESIKLIESAISTAKQFLTDRPNYAENMPEKVKEDCQLIDLTLIQSALPSAGINYW